MTEHHTRALSQGSNAKEVLYLACKQWFQPAPPYHLNPAHLKASLQHSSTLLLLFPALREPLWKHRFEPHILPRARPVPSPSVRLAQNALEIRSPARKLPSLNH